MTKFIQQRPQARALARRARGRRPKELEHSQPPVERDPPTSTDEPTDAPSGLGTQSAPRPEEPEVYRPKRSAGTYSLTGEARDDAPDPTATVYKPLVAKALLPALSGPLLDRLQERLLAGETHYPPRPGMPELRRLVATALSDLGGPEVEEEGVLITAGEGEALFATLFGMGVGAGDAVAVSGDWTRHAELFDILDVEPVPPGEPDDDANGSDDAIQIVFLGKAIPPASDGAALPLPRGGHLIYVGSLDALPEMVPFHLGYVAGPAERISKIVPWKQAFSICSAAPSQRAALFGFASLGQGRQPGDVA